MNNLEVFFTSFISHIVSVNKSCQFHSESISRIWPLSLLSPRSKPPMNFCSNHLFGLLAFTSSHSTHLLKTLQLVPISVMVKTKVILQRSPLNFLASLPVTHVPWTHQSSTSEPLCLFPQSGTFFQSYLWLTPSLPSGLYSKVIFSGSLSWLFKITPQLPLPPSPPCFSPQHLPWSQMPRLTTFVVFLPQLEWKLLEDR